jgi:hypothetical protein
MAKKTNTAKKASAEKRNRSAVADAISAALDCTIVDKSAMGGEACLMPRVPPHCGFVTAKLGNGGFRVSLKDGKEVQGLIRGLFKGGKNSEGFVCPGMYVILAPNGGRSDMKVHEIVGVINNKKDLKALKEAGLITESADKDDLFDYSDDESEKPGAADKSESAAAKEHDEIDVDAI